MSRAVRARELREEIKSCEKCAFGAGVDVDKIGSDDAGRLDRTCRACNTPTDPWSSFEPIPTAAPTR